ncbi:MAG: hypothetical protein ACTHMM_14075 [Agriterribacter sp.]
MKQTSFPYSRWVKFLGMAIIIAGAISFVAKRYKTGIFDFNELATGLSWGLLFIFFSKEKTDDEMIHSLKFKALAMAIIIAFSLTHLYNYVFLNWRLTGANGVILSVSAYQFLALTLMIATGCFYYMKHQATLTGEK